jgi:hypothetical protein
MPIIGITGSQNTKGFLQPLAPTIGTATDVGTARAFNNGAATVTFSPSATGAAATSFTVTSSPGGLTASGASSPLTVTGLQSNTSYTFLVKATNAAGDSPNSGSTSAITATTVPQAPTIGTATRPAVSQRIDVAFTAGATGGKAVSTFTATSSPSSITATNSASPIAVTGLANGTSYTFTVTATNANGTSSASGASNSIAPAVPLPTSVSDNFNRTTNPLGTSSSGHSWVAYRGTWQANGTVGYSGTAASSYPLSAITMSSNNATTQVGRSAAGAGVAFWVSDSNNWWGAVPYYDESVTYTTVCGAGGYSSGSGCGAGVPACIIDAGCSEQPGGGGPTSYTVIGQGCDGHLVHCADGSLNGFYGWNGLQTTRYPQNGQQANYTYNSYIRVLKNNAGYATHTVRSAAGYQAIQSMRVVTSGTSATITAFSSQNHSGQVGSAYSGTGLSGQSNGFGVLLAPYGSGTPGQENYVDNFSSAV